MELRSNEIIKYLTGTLLIFGLVTWISYHNGMAYDGETSIGFPLTFYTAGVGQSLDSGQMQQYSRYNFLALIADLSCSFLLCIALRFLLKWRQKSKDKITT